MLGSGQGTDYITKEKNFSIKNQKLIKLCNCGYKNNALYPKSLGS